MMNIVKKRFVSMYVYLNTDLETQLLKVMSIKLKVYIGNIHKLVTLLERGGLQPI